MLKIARRRREQEENSVVEVLHALADPVRLEIVRQLRAQGEKTCGSFDIEMPKSSLSHHFRVLREAGIVASESYGTVINNRLREEDLHARFPGLLDSILGKKAAGRRSR